MIENQRFKNYHPKAASADILQLISNTEIVMKIGIKIKKLSIFDNLIMLLTTLVVIHNAMARLRLIIMTEYTINVTDNTLADTTLCRLDRANS